MQGSENRNQPNMIGEKDFKLFASFLKDACGISLGPNKQYLISTRINRILCANNIDSLASLVERLKENKRSLLYQDIIDAMTTNETYWFRDSFPFDYIKSFYFKELMNSSRSQDGVRIWSAACSTGQEPYSIAFTIDEFKQANKLYLNTPFHILATDLPGRFLNIAKEGCYDELSMSRGLNSERVEKYFIQESEFSWRIKPSIQKNVEFRNLNLIDGFSSIGKFDLIFCRNVLIYFNPELKENILTRMHAALKPGGLLCLGSSEGLSSANSLFEMIQCKPGIMYRAI